MIVWAVGESNKPTGQNYVEEVYIKYKRLMFATAGQFTANLEDQEDIVQTALERLVKVFSEKKTSKRSISASYVVFTVRSVSIDFLRKQRKEVEYYVDIEDDQLADIAGITESLEDMLLPSDSAEQLLDIWPKLPSEDRMVLEGKYILDCTERELANILKCKPSSIRMKLTRARRRAIKLLSERNKNEQT